MRETLESTDYDEMVALLARVETPLATCEYAQNVARAFIDCLNAGFGLQWLVNMRDDVMSHDRCEARSLLWCMNLPPWTNIHAQHCTALRSEMRKKTWIEEYSVLPWAQLDTVVQQTVIECFRDKRRHAQPIHSLPRLLATANGQKGAQKTLVVAIMLGKQGTGFPEVCAMHAHVSASWTDCVQS